MISMKVCGITGKKKEMERIILNRVLSIRDSGKEISIMELVSLLSKTEMFMLDNELMESKMVKESMSIRMEIDMKGYLKIIRKLIKLEMLCLNQMMEKFTKEF